MKIRMAALAVLILPMFAQISVSAQEPRGEYRELEGSWNTVVTRLNCNTGAVLGTFPAMFTFSQGGTFWEAGTNTPPTLRGPSHGFWNFESRGMYTAAFQFFRFNADGTLAGRAIVRQRIQLSDDWTTYGSIARTQLLDVSGNVIATNCSSGFSTRFE